MDKLIVSNVYKRLGANEVLKGVSFELRRGEVVALLGPSGSGKTTLLRAIAGLDHPDTGRITLGNQTLFDPENGAQVPAERRNLGLVFQSYALWPHRTVFENIAYGLRLRRVPSSEVQKRVSAALGHMGLEGMAARLPHQLSGGQQQRVAIARAIAYNPQLLLLDEPLSNLDAKLREEARVWLRELIDRLQISAVCVTHDQVEAMALADRVILLDRGRVEQEGTPQEMYGEPATLFSAEFMGSNNRIPGTLSEVSGDQGKLAGEGWELWGRVRGPSRAGGPATGVIRLERTEVRETPADNSIEATLETSVYLGERWDSVFQTGALRIRVWTPAPPSQAARFLRFPRDSLWIFPA